PGASQAAGLPAFLIDLGDKGRSYSPLYGTRVWILSQWWNLSGCRHAGHLMPGSASPWSLQKMLTSRTTHSRVLAVPFSLRALPVPRLGGTHPVTDGPFQLAQCDDATAALKWLVERWLVPHLLLPFISRVA